MNIKTAIDNLKEVIEKARTDYCEKKACTRQNYDYFILKPIGKVAQEDLQFFADYFSNGSIDALLELCQPADTKPSNNAQTSTTRTTDV